MKKQTVEKYKTVSEWGTAEITEKRSRFIANVFPVETEEEALSLLEKMRKKYSDARHNVYAYVIKNGGLARYSDDGEPAQTAGLPVMDLIKKSGLSDILIVVTRYFGGILLGTGGLVHAYSKSAKEGILAAKPCEMILCREIFAECDYTTFSKLQSRILSEGYEVVSPIYAEDVKFKVFVPEDKSSEFEKKIIDYSDGKAKMSFGNSSFFPFCGESEN